jgi:hypothetical protein
MRSLVASCLLLFVFVACSSSSQGTSPSCASAGGSCVLGSARCAKPGPDPSSDCDPPGPRNPGGSFCCLELAQPTACLRAGGTCVDQCTHVAPSTAQDCSGSAAAGAICCLAGDGGATDAGRE